MATYNISTALQFT